MAALRYLESLRVAHPELAEWSNSLAELYRNKLWNQLTVKLEQFLSLAFFQDGDALIQIYHNFITDLATKINLMKLAHFAVMVSSKYAEKEAAITYLCGVINKLQATEDFHIEEPIVYLKMQIALFRLQQGDEKECEKLLDDGKFMLDSMAVVDPSLHASYYCVSSRYHKHIVDFASSHKSVLLQLAHMPMNALLLSNLVLTHYLLIARIFYRLIYMNPKLYMSWDWSCFLDLMEKFKDFSMPHSLDTEVVADIRWCSAQVLSIVLRLGDKAIESFGINIEEATLCFLRWKEFCQDVVGHRVSLFMRHFVDSKSSSAGGDSVIYSSQHLPTLPYNENELVFKNQRLVDWDCDLGRNPFVMTATLKSSFEMVMLAVHQRWPVLLYGPGGSGKTALVSNIAKGFGKKVLSIHMDDQIDGKTLVGSYVCTEQLGEFRWQHGFLIQAILNGSWVVFEDIDKASSDVQSILLPLLEGSASFSVGHGQEIRVAESFRLFSTISTSKKNVSRTTEGGAIINKLWWKVKIALPSYNDMKLILKAWFPSLEDITEKLIGTFDRVNHVPLLHHWESMSVISTSGSAYRFSLRDLLKWCKRISGLGFASLSNKLTPFQSQCIYQEGVDIFAAFLMSPENRLIMMREIAKSSGVPSTDVEMLQLHKPEIQVLPVELRIGRIALPYMETKTRGKVGLVETRSSLHALEGIASSVMHNEPVLLIGETGTGKTTLVQNLAMMLGQRLRILNLSQQSDVADLLGGFKPVDPQSLYVPLYKEFEDLFSTCFPLEENASFFFDLHKHVSSKNWKRLLSGLKKRVHKIKMKMQVELLKSGKKRKKHFDEGKLGAWEMFHVKLEAAQRQVESSTGVLFSFVEGAFVTALRNGEWILLDEVNLAPPESLQRVTGVLEGEHGSIFLAERGDKRLIPRHPNFRIFSCMNPANDAGKRELPHSLWSRFTKFFVEDMLDKADLKLFVSKFMVESISNCEVQNSVVDFYEAAKRRSQERLQDGANQKPQYSLRSLYRTLEYIKQARGKFGFHKAVYDGFSMFFLTMLDGPSSEAMKRMIKDMLLGGKKPPSVPFDDYLGVCENSAGDQLLEGYVLTKSVRKQLGNLARVVFMKRYPVLLQGPTSSGKTSLVQYLAARTGHRFVRINNHEHTDLQEYIGSYISDSLGKLVFHEGVLVKAVRNGYWIVLDELNLAPSDVLEALNRLLDDNRELFIPESREMVQAHPDFMLFATQNPPTFYGGRKVLSRAFRNRFVEVHVEEIPDYELSVLVEKKCRIPESRAKIMVEVMKELQLHRQGSRVFAGKHGFITPRDLFRWAHRLTTFGDSKEAMAEHGYYLLADRLRNEEERGVVQHVLEKHLRLKIVIDDLYKESTELEADLNKSDLQSFGGVIMTKSIKRLYSLVKQCYLLREPVLLVGETGGGKTTICQLLSSLLGSKLHILNCHQYTETSDFLGGFYPVRERSKLSAEFRCIVEKLLLSKAWVRYPDHLEISSDISQASSSIAQVAAVVDYYRKCQVPCDMVTGCDVASLEQMKLELTKLHQAWQTIFIWQDGPLVQAMRSGDLFLVDEISLADDSVLERLNSVLESEKTLSLAEKGGPDMEKIMAHKNFFVLATMNPGGDFGKKELSPALRNRFTEIWVPPIADISELRDIAARRLFGEESLMVDSLISFWEWFNKLQAGRTLTVRDLLSWIEFINLTKQSLGAASAFIHGIFLVLLDGLNLGTGLSRCEAVLLREKCLSFIVEQLKPEGMEMSRLSDMGNYGWGDIGTRADISCRDDMIQDDVFGINPFYIETGYENQENDGFEFLAPTTRRNAFRVLRAMQLPKPILLEGSPGVGKTSLVMALGKCSGHKVVRINLSEQTDLMDLLGSDMPVECDEGMKFAWSDGILLRALKNGSWVLLDELNLAPQSVLEGLNAILDHRAEVFIPELGRSYKCPPSFKIFGCQNPFSQGGGRKGLPRSFLNRFTKVYVDELGDDDYLLICSSLYPTIPKPVLSKLIVFNKRMHEGTVVCRKFGQDGAPWEFNLRDVIRSCEMIRDSKSGEADCFLDVIYIQRMRLPSDRKEVMRIFEDVFGVAPSLNPYPRVQLNPCYLTVGNAAIKRNNFRPVKFLDPKINVVPALRHSLEAIVNCVQHRWLCVLTGPPSSGKTSLIRLVAQLSGNVLNEISLTPATDISELLGSFEQFDALRTYRTVVARVEPAVNEYCGLLLGCSDVDHFPKRRDLIAKWLAFFSGFDSCASSSLACLLSENSGSFCRQLSLCAEILEELLAAEARWLPCASLKRELDEAMPMILKLQENVLKNASLNKFDWVTGLLVKAVELGEWVVLDNANLCNPTVLDRINSLAESGGSITINEHGVVEGSPSTIHPHDNFRLFLTVDPNFGEVSRAMRNRGVELFLMQPYWLLEETSGYDSAEFELRDVKSYLVSSAIPAPKIIDSMAKAHIFSVKEGKKYNIQITYHELSCWVQLFHQLLINGHQPLESLDQSWEFIYARSLLEAAGRDTLNHAKNVFLQQSFAESDAHTEFPLYLPCGWIVPLETRDFVCHSWAACARQNCLYLEYLMGRFESGGVDPMAQVFSTLSHVGACDMQLSFLLDPTFKLDKELNLKLAKKMVFFAASWTIEQSTVRDYKLYLLWFRWFCSKLRISNHLFAVFQTLLEQELEHPIWCSIFTSHRELSSRHLVDPDLHPIPLLSPSLDKFASINGASKSQSNRHLNAVSSVGVLRLSYHQWKAQRGHIYSNKDVAFKPVLESLIELEKEALSFLVESPSYPLLIKLYAILLERHVAFWDALIALQLDVVRVCWCSLRKHILKLLPYSPRAAENVLAVGSAALDGFFLKKSEQSLLWVHGGHPVLPASCKLFQKQQELMKMCELVWPTHLNLFKQGACSVHEVAASFNTDIRFLGVQGICMSSYITSKCDEVNVHVNQLEMDQLLLKRFDHEKHNLGEKMKANDNFISNESSAACCVYTTENLCMKSGFVSWLETLPIIDSISFFHDMDLLRKLSHAVLLDVGELQQACGRISSQLESAFEYSLTLSSRPPQHFIPHQKILWTLAAWTSVDSGNSKIISYVLEMWFWWHTTLWNHLPILVEKFKQSGLHDIEFSDMLLQPVKMSSVIQILNNKCAIKDYFGHSMKLRATSFGFWEDHARADISGFLFSSARCLFQQILYAHKKAFDADKFTALMSILQKNNITQVDMKYLCEIILSSSHERLKSSVVVFIEPILREIHSCYSSSTDLHRNIGYAWLRIGGLRLNLLLCGDDVDPALKYSCKYSQLEEKINLALLDIKVRQDCEYLAGWSSSKVIDEQRIAALEKLKLQHKRIQKKLVFRLNPSKFCVLMKECEEFFKLVVPVMDLVSNVNCMDFHQVADQVHNWQETASSFIDQLSNGYQDYNDFSLPIQVAIYEMKLGLSLVMSCFLQNSVLNKLEEKNIDRIMGSIYSFVMFPRGYWSKLISSHDDTFIPENFWETELFLLEKLDSFSNDAIDGRVSSLQFRASLYLNFLGQIVHFIADAKRVDGASFKSLDKILSYMATIWMTIKEQAKGREKDVAYKFKSRTFTLKSVVDIDVSTLATLLPSNTFHEWQELVSEKDCEFESVDEHENYEEELNVFSEAFLKNLIHLYNRLFGSTNDIFSSEYVPAYSDEKLSLFANCYALGARMITGLKCICDASLDMKLMSEHLLRVCLEHNQISSLYHKSSSRYNFYKDSNAAEIAKMVVLLVALQQRLAVLLSDCEDDPGLCKIVDAIEMLLAFPMGTPLAKALLGLQFLLDRIRILCENGSKIPVNEQLQPIVSLVCSWKTIEFDSWATLLDEAQEQHETNASRLWFPLFLVLQRCDEDDVAGSGQSVVESLEEFIQTSSIGEFRKRLQLLYAFHGHIAAGESLKVATYCSPWQKRNLKILYNVFGYYFQFLARILEIIEDSNKDIKKEVKELLTLCRWERKEANLSLESSKRTSQKLKKIILKYTDFLQQPVMMVFLNQEALPKGISIPSVKAHMPNISLPGKDSEELIQCSNFLQFGDNDSFSWFPGWRKEASDTIKNLQLDSNFLNNEDAIGFILAAKAGYSGSSSYMEDRNAIWEKLEQISKATMTFAEVWKENERRREKERAFSDLLKLLESSGLQKHKYDIMKISQDSSWLFLQPSYDSQHLLPAQCGKPPLVVIPDVSTPEALQSLPDESLGSLWKIVNSLYFKSIASWKLVQQICLKPHEDISYEKVSQSLSFLSHLVVIQQAQRNAAYGFSVRLKCLKECLSSLGKLYSKHTDCDDRKQTKFSIARNQLAIYDCLWKQKQLFDCLNAILLEESLLLRTVDGAHMVSCQSVKPEVTLLVQLIENLVPVVKRSKDCLDDYLFGRMGVVENLSHEMLDGGVLRHGSFECGSSSVSPFVISKEMELLVDKNFQVIFKFEKDILDLKEHDLGKRSIARALLDRFDDALNKGRLLNEELGIAMESVESSNKICNGNYSELVAEFEGTVRRSISLTLDSLKWISNNECAIAEASFGKITSWENLYQSYFVDLHLEDLYDVLLQTFSLARKLAGVATEHAFHIGMYFEYLHVILDQLLTFCEGLLRDLLAVHKIVSAVACVLANVLAPLFSKGFCCPSNEPLDDGAGCRSEDASGTGMGEGLGKTDISDQIHDEDQLLGASENVDEVQDHQGMKEKGIEMENDFDADMVSVSEESGEESGDEDDEVEQLDAKMGEAGANSEVASEKLWDQDEDENPNCAKEKYDSGPPVKDTDPNNRDLGCKEDAPSLADDHVDGDEEFNLEELDNQEDEPGKEGGEEEEMIMDKAESFADKAATNLDESNPLNDEQMDVDPEELDLNDEMESQEEEEKEEGEEEKEEGEEENEEKEEEKGKEEEEDVSSGESKEVADSGKMDPSKEMKWESSRKDACGDACGDAEHAVQANRDSSQPPQVSEEGCGDGDDDFASLASACGMETLGSESCSGRKLPGDPQGASFSKKESLPLSQPNPYRNAGDALEKWSERIKVSADLQPADHADAAGEPDKEEEEEEEEEEGDGEYGFVYELEKGTSQALGPAAPEQVNKKADGIRQEKENPAAQKEDDPEMQVEEQSPDEWTLNHCSSIIKKKMEQQKMLLPPHGIEKSPVETLSNGRGLDDGHPRNLCNSVVSLKKGLLDNDDDANHDDDEDDDECLEGSENDENAAAMGIGDGDAACLWGRYEVRTMRLANLLGEQLRLVLEPTLASKLQGDYKTGKRINMKKVIPYIASHYQKDKIWLRRSRPNKRDYQVVIAVDDSRSMSERCCGDFAVEALVTVCRAMSRMEIGSLAVTSFGKKGNVKLLHDFAQSFTSDVGIKILSSLTFSQENTITDEPVADLLKYLNNILDAAVARARLPSGHNPLQQLVLIIADGRFHEKDKLKRCVRDFLSRKRMVAFLLLDSLQESIMDQMEASFVEQGGERVIKFTKYLDSFPFPYYIVLRNIEELPNTLANLLRQWFELMQYWRE